MELCHASNCLWSQTLRELRYWTLSLQELPGIRRYKQTPIQNFHIYSTFWDTLQGTNISPQNGILKMIFLFPRWDMLIPWRVFIMCIPKKRKQNLSCNKIRVSGQFRGRVSRGTGGGPLSLASSGHVVAFWYGFKYHVESGPPIIRLGMITLPKTNIAPKNDGFQ